MDYLIKEQFSNDFLQMMKVSDLSWKNLISGLLNEKLDQQILIEETISHPQVQLYPPSTEYVKQFLKKFIYELENNGIEVNELLYNKYMTLISSKCENNEEYYRTYIKKSLKITLKETRNLIVDGTTGLRTWQASHVLTDYCLENVSLFSSKDVLELGAGLGLTGIALVLTASLKSYTFTDHHPKVLDFLKHNVNINLSSKNICEADFQEADYYKGKWQETDINIKCLDWEEPRKLNKYDFVIGADIIFDARLIPCLLEVVMKSLKTKGMAIFASTLRNEDTFNFFRKELESRGLKEEIEDRIYQESSSQPVDRIKIITFTQIEDLN